VDGVNDLPKWWQQNDSMVLQPIKHTEKIGQRGRNQIKSGPFVGTKKRYLVLHGSY
jgi:hypothetical protein